MFALGYKFPWILAFIAGTYMGKVGSLALKTTQELIRYIL